MIVQSFCAEDTYEIGKKIGQEAQPGQVICLYGDLGVGKTVFTKGLADGLGITEPIQSPTFTIVREYEEGRLPLYHFDVYRIGDIEEMDEIGYEDYVYGAFYLPCCQHLLFTSYLILVLFYPYHKRYSKKDRYFKETKIPILFFYELCYTNFQFISIPNFFLICGNHS